MFTLNGEVQHRIARQHSIYISNIDWDKLKQLAESKKTSISNLIKKIVLENRK